MPTELGVWLKEMMPFSSVAVSTVSFALEVFVPMATLPSVGAINTLPAAPPLPPVPAEPGCKVIEPPVPLMPPAGALPPCPATRAMLAPLPPVLPAAVVLPPLPPEVCKSVAAFVPLTATGEGCKPLTWSVAVGGATLIPILPVFSVMMESPRTVAAVNFAILPVVPLPVVVALGSSGAAMTCTSFACAAPLTTTCSVRLWTPPATSIVLTLAR